MKKFIIITIMVLSASFLGGCLKRDSLEGIDIYTTIYPIEYITERLYGTHSNVKSIYPTGINVDEYSLTDKQIKDYSKASMFIFNGLDKDKDYVIPMFNENKNIKIIDTTLSMEYLYSKEELWLDPSNFLMMAQNIRNGFKEYITNYYLKEEIDENYESLKLEVSNLDAKIKLMVEAADTKTIVVSSDVFNFLEKYNINVISLEENDNLTEKVIVDVKDLITSGEVSYIFTMENETINNTVKSLSDTTSVELITFNSISNLTNDEVSNKKDYLSLMNENIELLKNELYAD
jgi:zinc transport system substrate-binding protein